MRWTKILGSFFILLWLVGACVKQPEYSVVPQIDLLDVTFKKGNLTSRIPDTLIFKIKFTDGDGDLGVSGTDSISDKWFYSYNPWYGVYNLKDLSVVYVVDNTQQIPSTYSFINYKAKRTIPQFDTLPPISCGKWELLRDSKGLVKDTIYTLQNLKAYNINLDVYTKNGSGTYDKFNPTTYWDDGTLTSCAPNVFRATFPNLSNSRKSALDGVITFRIQSFYLDLLFSTKTLKMEVTISDRAFHVSNIAEKHDFTLQQIRK